MSKKPRTAAEYIWSNLKLKSTDSASIEDIIYYINQSGYEAFADCVTQTLQAFDKTKKGVISFKDFQEISAAGFDPLSSDDALNAIFNAFDTKSEGYLYADNLVQAARDMKVELSEEEAAKIIDSMDLDRDGAVDLQEFKQVLKA